MALQTKHKETIFGVGDQVRVIQKVFEERESKKGEGKKARTQVFEGIVIGIKGRGVGKTFTVRRIGAQQVGIEKIFPLESPLVEKVEVVKKGLRGARRAKLYYIRGKSRKEIEKIYSRAAKREETKPNAQEVVKDRKSKEKTGKTKNASKKK